MTPLRFVLTGAAFVAMASSTTGAQQPAPAAANVRVFLDCHFCDPDHLRIETPWVDFVRDRADANVHLLLTQQGTGSGGTQYTMNVIGLGDRAGRVDTVTFSTEPSSTEDARRNEIVRNIQLGLVPYALRSAAASGLRISRAARETATASRTPGRDPWNAWIFEVGGGASLDKEERQSELEYRADLEAQRVTSALKLGFSAEADFSRERFTRDNGETLLDVREDYSGGAVVVKSVARLWGLGAEVAASSSSYENTRLAVRVAPALEYSVWPYEEATRRQLTFQYSVGLSRFEYREETIYDRIRETRPTHAFVAGYDVRQPWGSAYAELEASSYLDDSRQNRIEFGTDWSLRITRGLNLSIGAFASLIHDQLSIPKEDASLEDILLQRRALQTNYRYDVSVGFSYTFGSIFNSVVNPRFGGGPGQILR